MNDNQPYLPEEFQRLLAKSMDLNDEMIRLLEDEEFYGHLRTEAIASLQYEIDQIDAQLRAIDLDLDLSIEQANYSTTVDVRPHD